MYPICLSLCLSRAYDLLEIGMRVYCLAVSASFYGCVFH